MTGSEAHRPKRSLGQNFLVDGNLQRRIVRAVGAAADDEVLEIGPGRGALTRHLVGTVRRLVLVELDDALAGALERDLGGRPDVAVLHADILEVRPSEHVGDVGRLKVVGNIPYGITTPIVFHLLDRPRPQEIVLMVQEEVARRITALPATADYGALSVGVQTVAVARLLFRVPRAAFRPEPRVDSAVVRITPRVPEPLSSGEEARLRRLVRAAFQWRRKQLGRILRDHPDLRLDPERARRAAEAVGFDLRDRPERLAPDAFVRLAAHLP